MTTSPWLRKPFARPATRPIRKAPARRRPRLEELEYRLAPTVETFVEPPVIHSSGGVLRATLTMAPTPATIDGRPVTGAWTYNGLYVGPTLEANPGDLLDITVQNRLPPGQATNLHTHGLWVSPLGNSDNVLLEIDPGHDNHYQIQIPADHPQGLYWYHPHFAGTVNEQIFHGLSGMLVIGRPDGGFAETAGYRERLFGVKNVLLDGSNTIDFAGSKTDSQDQIFTVNGVRNPTIVMRPNAREVWNIANLGNNAFFSAVLVNPADPSTPIPMTLVARDGQPQPYPVSVPAYADPPGKRGSLVVQAPATPGTYELRSTGLFDGVYEWRPFTIATLVVEGDPLPPPSPITTLTAPHGRFSFIDLRDMPVAEHRTIVLSQDDKFHYINGEVFPNPEVFQPRLNTVEEWTFINETPEHHPMHLHVDAMQTISINGHDIKDRDTLWIPVPGQNGGPDQMIPIGPVGYDDTVHVPPMVNGVPGVTVVRIFFRVYLGTVVTHCHRVDHEDNGMMALVTILPEKPIYAAASRSEVKVYDGQTNQVLWGVDAFPGSPGGMSVAVGDVNFDGVDDVAVGAGPGSEPRVKVYSGANRALLFDLLAFPRSMRGGVRVALGDVNGDGYKDIIVGAGSGPPEVRVFSGRDGSLLGGFLAYAAGPQTGVFVAAADVVGHGRVNIITGPGMGAAPEVRVFDDAFRLVSSFMAFDPSFRGGVTVGTGLITGRAFPSVVTGAGPGSLPEVAVFAVDFSNPDDPPPQPAWNTVARFLAFEASFRGGVSVSTVQTPHGDDLLVGRGVGGPPQVKRFQAVSLDEIASFLAFDEKRRDGVSVGG
jgi:FtsP/CotA-like multicopper oxidase with cupredoxin domain